MNKETLAQKIRELREKEEKLLKGEEKGVDNE